MNLTTLGTLCKWNHTLLFLRWLLSLSVMSSVFIHVVASDKTSFLRLNNISLHVYIPFGLFIYPSVDIWAASTFIFVYCDKCCYEHGNANIPSRPRFLFFWIHTQQWDFWGPSILFSIAGGPFYRPTDSARGSHFSLFSPELVTVFC